MILTDSNGEQPLTAMVSMVTKLTGSGGPLWSGPKRRPYPLIFDVNDLLKGLLFLLLIHHNLHLFHNVLCQQLELPPPRIPAMLLSTRTPPSSTTSTLNQMASLPCMPTHTGTLQIHTAS
ncbi:hypothetical protein MG293_020843 [Ovis ammon polii]|uniref:Ubiquitin-activating enzyme SCCH domain-containing protein n=1 Tax=Ovis ammon polii TaxID=230172 RepID=A0AAD4TMG0_OVIAM|nr:hypothetical protein MG293_020843 [Ovis ammon polii]